MKNYVRIGGGVAVIALAFAAGILERPVPAAHAVTASMHMAHHGTRATAIAVPAAPNQIVIDNFAFGPATLTVKRGTTVTWVNGDDDPHTVVNRAGAFKSPPLDTGDKFSFTFAEAGSFPYYCSIHPQMQGTVIVE